MPKAIVIIGAFDSKGAECAYLRERLLALGADTLTVNVGVVARYNRLSVRR